MKSEPSECSIDDLANAPPQDRAMGRRAQLPGAPTSCATRCGRGRRAVSIHSSCPEPGIAGIAEVVGAAYPDEPPQFEPDSPTFDPKSTPDAPRWLTVDVKLVEEDPLLSLAEMPTAPSSRRCGCCGAGKPAVDHAGDRRRMARRAASACTASPVKQRNRLCVNV
jgi:predicted RNA-binding protein with PUA-like domain